MMKITAMYTPPTDPDAFDEHYAAVHIPLVHQLPGLVRLETARAVGTPDGSPAPYFRTADLYFQDMDAVGAAFGSEPGQKAAQDAGELAARTGSTLSLMMSEIDAS